MDSSYGDHHDPAVLGQVARHGTPPVSASGQPHERDLDQPNRFAYAKPWERRRRLYWIIGIVALLVIAALAAMIAYVDHVAKTRGLASMPLRDLATAQPTLGEETHALAVNALIPPLFPLSSKKNASVRSAEA